MDHITMKMMNSADEEAAIMSEIEKHIDNIIKRMKDDGISCDDCDSPESLRLIELIKHLEESRAENEKFLKGNWISEIIKNFCPKTAEQLQRESDESTTPVMKAARLGNFLALKKLSENEKREQLHAVPGKTVLFALLDGIMANKYKQYPSRVLLENLIAGKGVRESIRDSYFPPKPSSEFPDETPNHYQCLEYVLKNIPRDLLSINFEDESGNTVLHYAVAWKETKAIIMLLQAGSYMCKANKNDMIPLKSISSQVLEEYLDSCISSNNFSSEHIDYQITIDYKMFMPQKQHTVGQKQVIVSESEPVLIIHENSRLSNLLSHPVIMSFLYLKWHSARIFFYANLMLYFIYWFLLNSHLYCIAHQTSPANNADISDESVSPLIGDVCELPLSYSWIILIVISCSMLIFRELNQIWGLPRTYFKLPENWLEAFLFASTFYLLFIAHYSPMLASAMILVSWLELVLLIGRHPLFSTHIEMFKTVSVNYFKYLFLYSIMILAFAFCFYALFNDAKAANGSASIFQYLNSSIFKTFFMIKSGFDYSSISSSELNTWVRLCSMLFTFLISTVLLSLLNGLAFGDTQTTRNQAELIGITSRINFIAHIDSMAAADPLHFLYFVDKLWQSCCCCFTWSDNRTREYHGGASVEEPSTTSPSGIHRRICLTHTLNDGKLKIFPNRKLLVQKKLGPRIIEGAVNVLKKKQSSASKTKEIDELCKQILQNLKTKLNSRRYPSSQEVSART